MTHLQEAAVMQVYISVEPTAIHTFVHSRCACLSSECDMMELHGRGQGGGWMGEVRSGWAMGVGEGRVHLLTGH